MQLGSTLTSHHRWPPLSKGVDQRGRLQATEDRMKSEYTAGLRQQLAENEARKQAEKLAAVRLCAFN